MKRFLKFLFRCAVPFLIYFSIENAVYLASALLPPEMWASPEFPLVLTGVTDLVGIPVLWALYRADGIRGERPADRSHETGAPKLLLSAVSFVGIYFAVNMVLNLFDIVGADEAFQEVSDSIESASAGLQFLVAGLIGPAAEELLFRGLLLRRTEKDLGPARAMLLASLMFGVFHGNLTQGIAAAVLGMCLGTAFLCTDSLLVPVLMHAASNSAAVLVSLPAMEEALESDLLFLAIPCFSALSAGVFLRMYAGPFRRLIRERRKKKLTGQTAAAEWPAEAQAGEEAGSVLRPAEAQADIETDTASGEPEGPDER